MSPDDIQVRLADWSMDEAVLRSVRTRVFVQEQSVPDILEWDGLDEQCIHAIAETGTDGVVGTGRLHPSGKIGRMAVLPPWRGRGAGAGILRRLLEAAAERGLDEVYLHAQVPVVGFYARLGFVAEGPEFDEADIPHRLMRLKLTHAAADDAGVVTGTRRLLSGKAEFADAVAEVASLASRSLAVFTPDLEHGVYDTSRFLEAVKRLVLSRSHARVRVLISDPARVQQTTNRFLHIGRRLSSFIEFRHLSDACQNPGNAYLIVDGEAIVYRALAERWQGLADSHEPRMARLYLGQFDQMWQLSEPAHELRETRL